MAWRQDYFIIAPELIIDMLWETFQLILPLYMKPISFQPKASVVCSVTTAVFIDSGRIGKKMNIWFPKKKSTGIEMLVKFLC